MDPAYATSTGGGSGVNIQWPSAGGQSGGGLGQGGSIFNQAGGDDDDDDDLYS